MSYIPFMARAHLRTEHTDTHPYDGLVSFWSILREIILQKILLVIFHSFFTIMTSRIILSGNVTLKHYIFVIFKKRRDICAMLRISQSRCVHVSFKNKECFPPLFFQKSSSHSLCSSCTLVPYLPKATPQDSPLASTLPLPQPPQNGTIC